MSNSKISALTSATTPLAGTETLPVVQGGATVKTTVASITGAGAYAGSFTTLASTGDATLGDATTDTVTVNGYMGVGGAAASTVGLYVQNTALTSTVQYGIFGGPTGTGTSQINGVTGSATTSNTAFTCTNLAHFRAANTAKGAASTITNSHGLYIEPLAQGTNNYGITSLIASGATNWNIYASGTAQNYFAGSVGIGVTFPRQQLSVGSYLDLYSGAASTPTVPSIRASAGNNLILNAYSTGITYVNFDGGSGGFIVANGAGGSLMTINSSGNMGLGTSSPNSRLTVYGTNTNDGAAYYTTNILNTAVAVSGIGSGLMFGTNISTTGTNNIGGMAGIEGIKENGTTDDYASALKFTTRINGGSLTERMRISSVGNITASTGNVVQGTAAKGFDFSANTPLAGKTSTLLNWYEEGTWTPNQGAGLTLVGAFSSTGKYTRVGRNVTVSGTVTGATSVAVTAAGVVTSNLPFTIGTAGHGNATNAANTAFAAVICNTGTTLTSAGAITATKTITFSATYFV